MPLESYMEKRLACLRKKLLDRFRVERLGESVLLQRLSRLVRRRRGDAGAVVPRHGFALSDAGRAAVAFRDPRGEDGREPGRDGRTAS